MFPEVCEERILSAVRRGAGQAIQLEVAPLELALAQIPPLGKANGLALMVAHLHGIPVDKIEREHVESGEIEVVRFLELQVSGEDLQQVCAAFDDVVRQKLDAVDAHEPEEREVPPLEIGLPVFHLHGGELALEDFHQEIPAPAGRLQKPRIDALGLALHQIKHRLNHPLRGEDLPVIGDSLFGFRQAHQICHAEIRPQLHARQSRT